MKMFQELVVVLLLGLGQCEAVDTMEQIRERLGNPVPQLRKEIDDLWNAIDEMKIIMGTLLTCGLPATVLNANAEISVSEGSATVNYACQDGVVPIGSVNHRTCSSGSWSDIGQLCVDVSECYVVVDGQALYSGTRSYTDWGYTCQRWDSQTPQSHNQVEELFPPTNGYGNETMESAANYCRDPDLEGYPWCYTTSLLERYQGCDIPLC